MSGAATSLAGFGILLVLGVVIEVRARRGAGPATAAQALGAAMRSGTGRLAVLVTWLWLGVHFLAR